MQIRTVETYDGIWTVFVGDRLCFSDLSEAEAVSLASAFRMLIVTAGKAT